MMNSSRLTVSAILLAATFSATTSELLAQPQERSVQRDIEYAKAGDISLKLDLYINQSDERPPVVIYIHGGGWRAGNKSGCSVAWLADHGYAVASIAYRLTDKAIFPAQIHDCKAAVRWVRANADKYGYSADKVAVAGSSAGGMLAALLGTSGDVEALEGELGEHTDQSSRVDAVIDFYGATDFVLRSKTQPHRANEPGSVVALLLGGGADKRIAAAKLASAAYHVTPDDPPFLVFHGDEDNTVLLDQSERIRDVYTEAGLPIDLRILKGAGHGGKAFSSAENRAVVLEFLRKHLL